MTTYFVLQPPSWPGAATHLCRPLMGPRRDNPDVPWVSVARSTAYGEFSLVRCDEVSGEQARALVDEAQEWIAKNQRQWQVLEQRGLLFWKKPSMVRVLNPASPAGLTRDPMDDLACEQIVCLTAMMEASGKLATSDLAVVIPKRGWLVVGSAVPGDLMGVRSLQEIARGVFGRAAEQDALDGVTVYHLKAGEIIGRTVSDSKGGFVSLATVDESTWNYPTRTQASHAS